LAVPSRLMAPIQASAHCPGPLAQREFG
jgi:hypothetical protein